MAIAKTIARHDSEYNTSGRQKAKGKKKCPNEERKRQNEKP